MTQPVLKLKRLVSIGKEATLGKLYRGDTVLATTMERGWKNNQRFVSRFPPGVYDVEPWTSPSKGACFLVKDVPDRDHILFHVANRASELAGCVGVGSSFGILVGQVATLHSRLTLEWMLSEFPEGFLLHVSDPDHDRTSEDG